MVGSNTAMMPQGFEFRPSTASAMTNEEMLSAAKSIRTAFIILASCNAAAAAATIFLICWDCRNAAKRRGARLGPRNVGSMVGAAETYPLVLSCGILLQAVAFAAIQSKGIDALLILGCTTLSQVMLPALFIVPLIQLVFGLETTVRALWRPPFPPRPKWVVPVCLTVVVLALISAYIVTRFKLPPNFCFAELMWLVQRWSAGCVGLLLGIALALLVACIIIFVQLYRYRRSYEVERVSAFWTACFTVLAVVILGIMIPFFWSLYSDDTGMIRRYQMQLSTAAGITANLTGITTGVLYLVLRSKKPSRIGRIDYYEFDRQKSAKTKRAMTPSNFMYTKQMEQPVSPVLLEHLNSSSDRIQGDRTTMWPSTAARQSPETSRSRPAWPAEKLSSPETTSTSPMRKGSVARDNYQLFPPVQDKTGTTKPTLAIPQVKSEAAGDLSDDVLLPPPSIWAARRQRNSSLGSSATVQIGLRVSNINDMPPVSYYGNPSSEESSDAANFGVAISTDADPFGDGNATTAAAALPEEAIVDEPDKSLPPVPLIIAKKQDKAPESKQSEEIRLSPSVYSPDKKKPSRSQSSKAVGNKSKDLGGRPPLKPPPRRSSWSSEVQSVEWI
ncbi:hypothetical protein CDD82_6326 [Ophiocordyceps australis]|uniref:Uncharacterized protein n=1 Tax=Ophiocordyceps australis TaxID=1399860 RepID=A0A2C5YVQ1_9HYPO|nr:hypothetical protein CDD82_6326 [Ophiocordyceps australis]